MKSLGLLCLAGLTAVPVGAVVWTRAERGQQVEVREALEAVPGGATPAAAPARASDRPLEPAPRVRPAEPAAEIEEPELVVPAPPPDWRGQGSLRRSLGATRRANGGTSDRSATPPAPVRRRRPAKLRSNRWYDEQPAWRLIDELRDDDVRWNATAASSELRHRLWSDAALRLEVHEAALPWIASQDQQLSLLTGGLVLDVARAEAQDGATYWPTEELLDQAAGWLIERPTAESHGLGGVTQWRVVRFALEHVDSIESRLLEQVRRPAGRDVFLSAFVLGASQRWEHADQLAPLLIPRLRANDVYQDACMAQEALIGLGAGVVDHLEAARPDADAQQLATIDAILWELRWPARTPQERFDRRHLNVLTRRYHCAAASWRFRGH